MPTPRRWLARARRALAGRLDQLNETLVTLTLRLRDTVAQAVSGSLAGAVREAVHSLLTDGDPGGTAPPYLERPYYRPRPSWADPDRYDGEGDRDDWPADEWSDGPSRGWREVACEPPEPSQQDRKRGRARFYNALAVGCQAAAWWLRRQASRASALAAFGLGLAATGAAFVAGGGLAESALRLLSLADALRSGAHASAFLS